METSYVCKKYGWKNSGSGTKIFYLQQVTRKKLRGHWVQVRRLPVIGYKEEAERTLGPGTKVYLRQVMRKKLWGHCVQVRRLVYLQQLIRKRPRGHWVQVTEAVPSINYIGRQLDVSYICSEIYGESVLFKCVLPWVINVKYCPTINTYKCDPYRRKKGKLITNLIWTRQTILNIGNCTLI